VKEALLYSLISRQLTPSPDNSQTFQFPLKARVACSRRSDSGARAKKKASERAGKKTRGNWGRGRVSSRFFPALSLAFFFARAPLSERLEQAKARVIGSQL